MLGLPVKIEFDLAKNEWNIKERGISFVEAELFDFETAIRAEDERKDYGETRIVAYGFIGKRLHVMCYKPLAGFDIRVISLRKANRREVKIYEKNIKAINR